MTECTCCGHVEPCAARISIFQHLDHDSLKKISNLAIHKTVKKGTVLFSPQESQGLYLISEGKVKVYEITPSGKEYLLRVLGSGEFVGEAALFGTEHTYTFAEALTDINVCFIRRDDFLDLLRQYPSISLKLLEEFNRRLVKSEHNAASNMNEPIMNRLVKYLLDLASEQEKDTITVPLQLKELSAYLSTTPETLSRRLAMLQEHGLIQRKNREITLTDREQLQKIIQEN